MAGVQRRLLIGIALQVVLLVLVASPAFAHADLVSTDPVDGSESDEPIERIELVFSEAVAPVRGGIRLIQGRRALDIGIYQPSDAAIVIEPAAPLEGGRYALLWRVQSDDLHVVEGTVSLAVAEASGGPEDDVSLATDDAASAKESERSPPATLPATSATLPMVSTVLPAQAFETEPITAQVTDPTVGEWMARAGRWVMMTGALVAIGALAFAGMSLVGGEDEVRRAVGWVRWSGIGVLLGTVIEVIGVSATLTGSLAEAVSPAALVDVLAGAFGIAVLLRLAGGIALLQEPRMAAIASVPSVSRDLGSARAFDATGETRVTTAVAPRFRLDLKREWVALAGVVAVAASFMFDGHSNSVALTAVARGSSFVHVLGAGVWFGGLVVMAATLAVRRARGAPLEAARMSIRFSRLAAAALVLLALTGLALTWAVIEDPADVTSSPWGRLLLLKVVLVVVAAGLGGYNHFEVLPALDRDPADTAAAERLRRVVYVEVVLLVVVVACTAGLVGAST